MSIEKKIIKNIIGNPKKRGGKNDWDGDGVKNKKDCQPRNTMRQDAIRPINSGGYDMMTPGDMGESAMAARMQAKSQQMRTFRKSRPTVMGGKR